MEEDVAGIGVVGMRSCHGVEETEEDRVLRHVEEDVEEEWFVMDAVDVGT